jgi:hypothetical protein
MATVLLKKETRTVLGQCNVCQRDEAPMARFAVDNPHLVQTEYKFWASKAAKKEEENNVGPSVVIKLISNEDGESGYDID